MAEERGVEWLTAVHARTTRPSGTVLRTLTAREIRSGDIVRGVADRRIITGEPVAVSSARAVSTNRHGPECDDWCPYYRLAGHAGHVVIRVSYLRSDGRTGWRDLAPDRTVTVATNVTTDRWAMRS